MPWACLYLPETLAVAERVTFRCAGGPGPRCHPLRSRYHTAAPCYAAPPFGPPPVSSPGMAVGIAAALASDVTLARRRRSGGGCRRRSPSSPSSTAARTCGCSRSPPSSAASAARTPSTSTTRCASWCAAPPTRARRAGHHFAVRMQHEQRCAGPHVGTGILLTRRQQEVTGWDMPARGRYSAFMSMYATPASHPIRSHLPSLVSPPLSPHRQVRHPRDVLRRLAAPRGRRAALAALRPGNCPGRHGHSTLSLTGIDCHSLRIYTVILLPLLSFSV